MKYLILTIVVAVILLGTGYWLTDNLAEIASTKISRKQAVENVRNLPEVQEFLKNVPNGRVAVDNELEGEYNVHVYEVKNDHTATFNWYRVSINSGEVKPEFQFDFDQEQEL